MSAKKQPSPKGDWDLNSTKRLLKEKMRLGISDERMANMLGLHPHFYRLLCDEKPDIKIYELPGDILATLDNNGIDLFYVMTGEHSSDNYEIMLDAFNYSIQELPLDKQDEVRELVEPIFEKLMRATNGGKHSMLH
ncbi:hypothetical protein RBW71_001051 [Salmonella enterica]|nr:hypothetical protein [Salmonella enterica subsp. enterica serovar Newport]ELE8949709.1 hypothetical protein [Salmonella enterica]